PVNEYLQCLVSDALTIHVGCFADRLLEQLSKHRMVLPLRYFIKGIQVIVSATDSCVAAVIEATQLVMQKSFAQLPTFLHYLVDQRFRALKRQQPVTLGIQDKE